MHKNGLLGGQTMPEDARPKLPKGSKALVHYLTFPMALNYQRNSYALWKAATAAYNDPDTGDIFNPEAAAAMPLAELRRKLLKHRVGLQPVKHTSTWKTLAQSACELFDGDFRTLFLENGLSAANILRFIQITHKKRFPYLSGVKIANYWLYVIHTYTDFRLKDPHNLSIAPDTHVLQASFRLGLTDHAVTPRGETAQKWLELLDGTGLTPIDVHTPLWLWSRSGFIPIINS
jgi:hypothetical protein